MEKLLSARALSFFVSGLASGLVGGCSGDDVKLVPPTAPDAGGPDLASPPMYCAGATKLLYDPLGKALDAFPDDYWTVDDGASATGLRVKIVPGDNLAPLSGGQAMFGSVFGDLSLLDGFGTTAGMFVKFSGPLDPKSLPKDGDGSGAPGSSIVLVDLDAPMPTFINTEFKLTPEKANEPITTLVVQAMVPLRPKGHYGLAITTRVHDESGGCVAPSATMIQLLSGTATDPALKRLQPRYTTLLSLLTQAGTIKGPTDLTAAFVFTMQHTVDDSAGIAADIRKRTYTYTPAGACVADMGGLFKTCEGSFMAFDYRDKDGHLDDHDLGAKAPYKLPVVTYVPMMAGSPPYRTMIYGHGLGGDRHQAGQLAALASPKGYAVVAVDAVKHGDHPDKATPNGLFPNPKLDVVMSFFGLTLAGVDSRHLRDNWRQSTYDKLQLVELLRNGGPGLDVDGDAKVDVGVDSLMYLGVSLGGIMSAEFVTFVPEVKVAIPIVPGARVTDIIASGKDLGAVVGLFKSAAMATDGDIARFFPLLQTAIDRGDSGVYTPHMVGNRLAGFNAQKPQVLMQMVIDDTTVPNTTNRFFARGLGVPHVGDELQHIGTIPHDQKLPVTGNLDAKHTGGVFQYDIDWNESFPCCDMDKSHTQMATHGNVAGNPIAIDQTLRFIKTYFDNGVSELIDPYRDLKVKP